MDERRKKAVQRHNAKTNVQGINFGIGDFVLVGIADPKKSSKLALRWDGPAKVIELGESEQTFLVEDLLSGKARIVHSTRLMHYADEKLGITEEVEEHLHQEREEYWEIEQIVDIERKEDGEWYCSVKWKGWEEETQEPIKALYKDVPELMHNFIMNIKDKKLRNQLRRACP